MKPIISPLYLVSWDGERFVCPFSPSFFTVSGGFNPSQLKTVTGAGQRPGAGAASALIKRLDCIHRLHSMRTKQSINSIIKFLVLDKGSTKR
jgi:hypothetical protein